MAIGRKFPLESAREWEVRRRGSAPLLGRFPRFLGESSALLLESRRLALAEPPPSAGRVCRPGGVTKEALCRGWRYSVVFAWATGRLRESFAACPKKLWLLALSGNSHSSCTPGTEWQVESLLDASRRRSLVRRLFRRRLLVERRWRLILPQRIEVSTASSDVHLTCVSNSSFYARDAVDSAVACRFCETHSRFRCGGVVEYVR